MRRDALTDKTEIEEALRAAGDKYVAIHLDKENHIYEGIKVQRIEDGDDPVFIVAGDGIPEVRCQVSNIRNCQIGY